MAAPIGLSLALFGGAVGYHSRSARTLSSAGGILAAKAASKKHTTLSTVGLPPCGSTATLRPKSSGVEDEALAFSNQFRARPIAFSASANKDRASKALRVFPIVLNGRSVSLHRSYCNAFQKFRGTGHFRQPDLGN